ncbi:hypothetical protein, partial [Pseudomonas asplenii]|uniref:hypothetical protein n=1 Tax=Pseudomonas asplenii TaxID=53407 RepID=UPI00047546AE
MIDVVRAKRQVGARGRYRVVFIASKPAPTGTMKSWKPACWRQRPYRRRINPMKNTPPMAAVATPIG